MVKRKKSKITPTEIKDESPQPVQETPKQPEQEGYFASDIERLEFKILTMEVVGLEKDAKILRQQIDILEREKMTNALRVSDINARLTQKKKDSNQMLEGIAKKIGLTAKSITLDTDTGEIGT